MVPEDLRDFRRGRRRVWDVEMEPSWMEEEEEDGDECRCVSLLGWEFSRWREAGSDAMLGGLCEVQSKGLFEVDVFVDGKNVLV